MSQRVEHSVQMAKYAGKMVRFNALLLLGIGLQGLGWQLAKPPTTMRTIGLIGWSGMIVFTSAGLLILSAQLRRAAEAVE